MIIAIILKVKQQINSGVLLSLSHPVETELAETLSSIIPYAEMVKFGKITNSSTN